MPHVHSAMLRSRIHDSYTLDEVRALTALLVDAGTFRFPSLANGLFPAATSAGQPYDYTGYSNIWVRDNIQIAHAHWVLGQTDVAAKNAQTLMQYFRKNAHRFIDILSGKTDPLDPMVRPHIRFNGRNLSEIDEKWAHAQNDALGYFLWFYSKLVRSRALEPTPPDLEILASVAEYFRKIRYWQDEDSGHWEELRKVSASSIGVATAGLVEFRGLAGERKIPSPGGSIPPFSIDDLDHLIAKGREALKEILPSECVHGTSDQIRRYDAALLFLIYPTDVVEGPMADQIVADVIDHLQGEYGIRRYLGDSYWCANYKVALPPTERTVDFSDDLSARDRLLKPGEEAQWCIFDPILSIIDGLRYQREGKAEDLARQVHYLNRSLGQLTGEEGTFPSLLCPESYYLESGHYVPNDITPLLWTQANLRIALKTMEQSLLADGRLAAC